MKYKNNILLAEILLRFLVPAQNFCNFVLSVAWPVMPCVSKFIVPWVISAKYPFTLTRCLKTHSRLLCGVVEFYGIMNVASIHLFPRKSLTVKTWAVLIIFWPITTKEKKECNMIKVSLTYILILTHQFYK